MSAGQLSTDDLLTELERAGVRLWEDDGRLRFRAPPGVMSDERRELLREHRDELLVPPAGGDRAGA